MSTNSGKILKVVNICIAVVFLLQAGTGFSHELIPFAVFEKVHGVAGLMLTIGVALHIYLNRKWFFTVFRKH